MTAETTQHIDLSQRLSKLQVLIDRLQMEDTQHVPTLLPNIFVQCREMLRLLEKAVTPKDENPLTTQPLSSADPEFIIKLRSAIDAHIEDESLEVTHLCAALLMSRSQLHRKLKAVTGKCTTDFIRNHRLERAAQFFRSGERSVSQVAYRVGFNNLSYFSKRFKEKYRILPSEYVGIWTKNTCP